MSFLRDHFQNIEKEFIDRSDSIIKVRPGVSSEVKNEGSIKSEDGMIKDENGPRSYQRQGKE